MLCLSAERANWGSVGGNGIITPTECDGSLDRPDFPEESRVRETSHEDYADEKSALLSPYCDAAKGYQKDKRQQENQQSHRVNFSLFKSLHGIFSPMLITHVGLILLSILAEL